MYAYVCVEGGGGILWDACPLISLCVCARARGVCSVRERERGDDVVCTRCHKNTEIYLNCVYTVTSIKKEPPSIDSLIGKLILELLFWKLCGIKL